MLRLWQHHHNSHIKTQAIKFIRTGEVNYFNEIKTELRRESSKEKVYQQIEEAIKQVEYDRGRNISIIVALAVGLMHYVFLSMPCATEEERLGALQMQREHPIIYTTLDAALSIGAGLSVFILASIIVSIGSEERHTRVDMLKALLPDQPEATVLLRR